MIEIKNLGKVFTEKSGKVVALRNASAIINDGDIFGVIGMSGAGKSTLLRCLCLLEKPSEGQICAWPAARWAWCSRATTC